MSGDPFLASFSKRKSNYVLLNSRKQKQIKSNDIGYAIYVYIVLFVLLS